MKTIKRGTRQANIFETSYHYALERYGIRRELSDCYVKPSSKKKQAIVHCHALQQEMKGFNGTITGYNVRKFSYAFSIVNSVSGAVDLIYITANNTYLITD